MRATMLLTRTERSVCSCGRFTLAPSSRSADGRFSRSLSSCGLTVFPIHMRRHTPLSARYTPWASRPSLLSRQHGGITTAPSTTAPPLHSASRWRAKREGRRNAVDIATDMDPTCIMTALRSSARTSTPSRTATFLSAASVSSGSSAACSGTAVPHMMRCVRRALTQADCSRLRASVILVACACSMAVLRSTFMVARTSRVL
mmetsp:Transcript_14119/g.30145  ORF Transcript_14119/g.30145 Transcript_14119/m.30145 type:complete len:202 (+) Transcript_14119:253-858(+)